jgi:hypothetical protein
MTKPAVMVHYSSRRGGVAMLILLFLLGATIMLGGRIREVSLASLESADLGQLLPDRVGEWRAERVFFCQHDQCASSFMESELEGTATCPSCGGKLDQVALGERTLLPEDTVIIRRQYQGGQKDPIMVTLVLSGKERRSIHRPQQCLPAQGFTVESSSVLSVPLEGRDPLKLTLMHARKAGGGGGGVAPAVVLAYWFAGGGHETHDHFERMGYMAWDVLIHGVRARWTYVSLQKVSRGKSSDAYLSEFIRKLYPLLKDASVKQGDRS